jgi:uncharacterized protein (DUF1015 family)
MAEIRAFRAFRYNPNKVQWHKVLTQPYDKITPAMQEHYYSLDPHNLISVEKGRTLPDDSPQNSVYTRAAASLEKWISSQILLQDSAPAIYAYAQEFFVPGTHTRRTRRGFIALGRLEDYSAGVVFRHERTLSGPKADRLELLRHTRTQTGQLFMLYSDPEKSVDRLLGEVMREPATCELRDEYDVHHRLWPITDTARIAEITQFMAGQKLVIADGHHRYETALAFRDECRARANSPDPNAAHEYAMMTLVNSHSDGLVILPTHRVVARLKQFDFAKFREAMRAHFDWYSYPFSDAAQRSTALADFRKDLALRSKERRAIGVYAGSGAFLLYLLRRDANLSTLLPDVSPAQRQLDVVLLHGLLLERGLGITAEAVRAESHVRYEREMEAALRAVDQGEAQISFLLNPVRVGQVMDMALGGEVLPQKSTDFYPKMLSGVANYRMA